LTLCNISSVSMVKQIWISASAQSTILQQNRLTVSLEKDSNRSNQTLIAQIPYLCMSVCCGFVCNYVSVCTYVRHMSVCMYVGMYVCKYECTHVCICMYVWM
jgi:hypothetical protein